MIRLPESFQIMGIAESNWEAVYQKMIDKMCLKM